MTESSQARRKWESRRNLVPSLQDRYQETRKIPIQASLSGRRGSCGWILGSQHQVDRSSQNLLFAIDHHQGKVRVMRRDQRRNQRPLDSNRRIVPANATRTFRMVELRDLIEHFSVIPQRLKAVGQSLRNGEHAAVLRTEFDGNPLQKRGRIIAQINQYVMNCPASAAHEFSLRVRFSLIVHTAKRPFPGIERNAALSYCGIEPVPFKFLRTKCARKEPAIILISFRFNEVCAGYPCFEKAHRSFNRAVQ